MNTNHTCLIIKPRATDYIKGTNSPIQFKAVTSGDWTSHLYFNELQKINDFETNGCVLFTAQESFDAQMDVIWPTLPQSVQQQITDMGYLDIGTDGKLHFHSSPRFLQVLAGNGFNGNSLQDPWDVMRKYGVLPWKDLPFDASITQAEYLNPIPQASLDKAAQFLNLMGGKNAIQYHWIVDNGANNPALMSEARQQSPLCVSVYCNDFSWNFPVPEVVEGTPCHSIQNYNSTSAGEQVLDHYLPFDKLLVPAYPIPYVMQGVVNFIAPVEQEIVNETATVVSEIAKDTITPPSIKQTLLQEIEAILERFL